MVEGSGTGARITSIASEGATVAAIFPASPNKIRSEIPRLLFPRPIPVNVTDARVKESG